MVPVDGPTLRPSTRLAARAMATDAPSGTLIILSTTPGTKLFSTRLRPMPSMREALSVRARGSASRHPGRNAENSGSATARRVSWRR